MTYNEIKHLLIRVRDNHYLLPEDLDVFDKSDLIAGMLDFIGHVDTELRDGLIYSVFNTWTDNGVLTTTEMKMMLDTCLDDEHLFLGIGERETDTVFTRSFSLLVIPLAMCMDKETPFLSDNDVRNIKDTVIRYIKQERDYRGYVEGKGWAHAIAHAADALGNIASHKNMERNDLLEILDILKTMILNEEHVYTAEEDERIAQAFMCVYERKILSDDEIRDWSVCLYNGVKDWWEGKIPHDFNKHVNRKHFMRSLYFMLDIKGFIEMKTLTKKLLNN